LISALVLIFLVLSLKFYQLIFYARITYDSDNYKTNENHSIVWLAMKKVNIFLVELAKPICFPLVFVIISDLGEPWLCIWIMIYSILG
jgi:hypothetical protein